MIIHQVMHTLSSLPRRLSMVPGASNKGLGYLRHRNRGCMIAASILLVVALAGQVLPQPKRPISIMPQMLGATSTARVVHDAPIKGSVVSLTISPGRLGVPNTIIATGVYATEMQLLSESLDMPMGVLPYVAAALGRGRWLVNHVYVPMDGRWALTVQIQRDGKWILLRRFIYQVPRTGMIRSLTTERT